MKRFCFLFLLVFSFVVGMLANTTHVVDRGETLSSIAQKYGVTEQEIINLNPEAAQFVYTGMELIIPEQSSVNQTLSINQSSPTTDNFIPDETSYGYEAKENNNVETDDFEKKRKDKTFELHYSANSFEHAKMTGSYGFSFMLLPWKLYEKVYAGVYISPLNFNFGLVPSKSAGEAFKLGPAISYYFKPEVFVAMPIAVDCYVYNMADKAKTAWDLEFSPALYLGSGMGIFFGPLLYIPFDSNAKASCGFRVGLYF